MGNRAPRSITPGRLLARRVTYCDAAVWSLVDAKRTWCDHRKLIAGDPQRTSTTGHGLFLAFSPHRGARLEARGILDEDEQDAVIEAANLRSIKYVKLPTGRA